MLRLISIVLALLAAILISACDLWPKELEPLAASISQQVSGETTAWLVGGEILVIDVADSPVYRAPQSELEELATGIAEQAIGYTSAPLESITITFHEGEVTSDPKKMRDFIFLVMDKRPVLQPTLDLDATGPLTVDEIRAAFDRLDATPDQPGKILTGNYRECMLAEVEQRARDAGDPETLDPSEIEFLTAETWYPLDAFGKRIILMQAIMSKALFVCIGPPEADAGS